MTGDDIAVVGMACRFPGAMHVRRLWANLCAGVDAIHDYSEAELRALGLGERLLADPALVRAGGRLPHDPAEFDAEFFGFDADEARRTDPQHRVFLETAWEAMEDAGYDAARVSGPVGVFASAAVNRYFLLHGLGRTGHDDQDDWEGRLADWQSADHLAGQVAYRFGATGPAVGVQAACASSLVAVCLAAQNLLDYRCDLAIAGGVALTWPRYRHTPGGTVSPDGRCRSFDAAAAGSGYGSGAGAVVLKRLADAQADGDHVYAVLAGWAVTNDGANRAGWSVPGVEGLAAAVTEALTTAEISAADIGFVETHGSGTPLGDAIEVAALNRAFTALGATRENSCALGCVKSAIGHLDTASGIAGLITAVLAVHTGSVPGNQHFRTPHQDIEFARGPFFVPREKSGWPLAGPRIAAVNALGVGGTAAHVVLTQPPSVAAPAAAAGRLPLPVSARSPLALRAALTRLRDWLRDGDGQNVAAVAYTLAFGRRAFPHRAVLLAEDVEQAVAAIDALLAGDGPGPVDLPPAARRWAEGEDVDWAAGLPWQPRRTPLPTYPFERGHYWIGSPEGATGEPVRPDSQGRRGVKETL